MDLEQAIKLCLEAGVEVTPCIMEKHRVYLPKEIFLEWFTEYTVENVNEALHKLTAVENGVKYKCYAWEGEY